MKLPVVLAIVAVVAAGCATAPRPPDSRPAQARGAMLAEAAARLVGTPYRYGGDSPRSGFDCSGLVFYTHGLAGLAVPRTAADQQRAARPVPLRALEPGDLLFFRISGRKVDHVGIYAGDGRFIHAPQTGRAVTYARLDDAYYRRRLVGAGRLWCSEDCPR